MTEAVAEAIQVLLVEDEPGDAGLAKIALRDFHKARFNVAWSQTLTEAIQQLANASYDIILLDLTLPDSTGIATLERITDTKTVTPIIVLTGQSDADFGLNILKAGAADFLVKGDFGYDGLARTIVYTLHRAKLERELADYRFHLEELVNERTAELAFAKEAAEAANRAKTAFLTNMSHELRTPLNAILGFAQLMERDPALDESHRQELRTINRSGQQLLALINSVLEIARIEAGRATIVSRAFDLNSLLQSVENTVRPRAEAKGLAFNIELHEKLPDIVVGDPQRLKQVLFNLLGNAVKYTMSGRIGLSLTPIDDHIHFAICDTGPGIPISEQALIFQAFYQIDSHPALGEGAGLGLPLSREFVRLMGGDLCLESHPGQGSTFYFDLPLPAADSATLPAPDARIIGLQAGQFRPCILIASKAGDNRDWLADLIGNSGLTVHVVEDGTHAVEQFSRWRPDLIWMVEDLPLSDHIETCRQIRALPEGDHVKIVCQCRGGPSVILDEQGLPYDERVSIPLDADRVFRTIGNLLNLQAIHAEPEPDEFDHAELDLSSLDRKIRLQITHAAEALDIEALSDIIAQLNDRRPEIANVLKTWADNFRFERIKQAADIDTKDESR